MMNIVRIDDMSGDGLVLYRNLSETELYHYNEPDPGFFIAESPKVIRRALDAGYEPASILMDEQQFQKGAEGLLDELDQMEDLTVYVAPQRGLRDLTGFPMTRGCLSVMRRRRIPGCDDLLREANRVCILENVVNPTNVGAVFRSAAALGMDAVLMSHGCCDPLYRRAVRVSMGTVFQVPWTFMDKGGEDGPFSWPQNAIPHLRETGFVTLALALSDRSVPIDTPALMQYDKVALVLGTEGEGLSEETIRSCDHTVRIPMAGGVDSLNVAAASAVAFWQFRRPMKE